jgi:hypothetical protein
MLFKKSPRPPQQRNCAHGGRELSVRPSRIEKSQSGLVFCSHDCAAHYQASLLDMNAQCHYCGKRFHRSPSELEEVTSPLLIAQGIVMSEHARKELRTSVVQ